MFHLIFDLSEVEIGFGRYDMEVRLADERLKIKGRIQRGVVTEEGFVIIGRGDFEGSIGKDEGCVLLERCAVDELGVIGLATGLLLLKLVEDGAG